MSTRGSFFSNPDDQPQPSKSLPPEEFELALDTAPPFDLQAELQSIRSAVAGLQVDLAEMKSDALWTMRVCVLAVVVFLFREFRGYL